MARRHPISAITRHRGNHWAIGIAAGTVTLAALVVGAGIGTAHATGFRTRLISWVSAAVVLVAGVVGTARLATALSRSVASRSTPGAGGAVRVLVAVAGYLFVLFAILGVLTVTITHLLVGAGLAGVVLGIAAQQSLGNVFAGLVLLLSRPFGVGDHVRVRSGALGGIFDAWVDEMSLTYVTLGTDEGELKVPNSAMLAAGVLRLPPGREPAPLTTPAPSLANAPSEPPPSVPSEPPPSVPAVPPPSVPGVPPPSAPAPGVGPTAIPTTAPAPAGPG